MNDRNAAGLLIAHETTSQFERLICGVVEHLNFEQFTRVINFAGGTNDALGDVQLVEEGQLNRDNWITRDANVLRRLTSPPQKHRNKGGVIQTVERQPEQCYAIHNYNGQP